jgi:glyoxylase-like metal-dependent hydrolase (beta-lactamase superfamily II)
MRVATITSPVYSENCHVLAGDTDPGAVIIDPGALAADAIAALVAEASLEPAAVVLTHGHHDHVWEAADVAARHGVPVWLHPADMFWMEDPSAVYGPGWDAVIREQFAEVGASPQWRRPPDIVPIETGADGRGALDLGPFRLDALHAPGHTPGSTVFSFAETGGPEGGPVLVTGDVLFRLAVGRTDLVGGSDAEMRASLRAVGETFDPDSAILPGHGAGSVLRVERKRNPFLRAALAD